MPTPYVGEIRMVAFNFAPVGWAACDGTLVPISENETLFNIIGTTYGGDGESTFALPNLLGRVPVHMGNSFTIGQIGGTESVTLNINQIPSHTHPPQCTTNPGTAASPEGQTWAACSLNQYSNAAPNAPMAGNSTSAGGGQPHENRMPFVAVNFVISLFGIFPSQN